MKSEIETKEKNQKIFLESEGNNAIICCKSREEEESPEQITKVTLSLDECQELLWNLKVVMKDIVSKS